ncbi:dienelactone hydrolase family protein [Pseudovibrio sp. Ad26]|uniref:dienelactone hydrolase family protein n=1 Tax=Pseudovibrio sp. Ad26 TaxID=989410 RepID=UPI0007AE9D89|nr:dienelactone hydrolase family protein [Pseudovibrio sp. Ad26]KZL15680.1 Dienelactone hydrolase family protein [Pseudovibrio sp. Ad26]
MIIAATTLALPASLQAAELRLVEYHQRNLAYIIVPRTDKKLPALVLFHDWAGLTEEAILQAAKIAEEGYAVFLPDLFGGKAPQSKEEAQPLVEAILETDHQHELMANVHSGLQVLENVEEVEPVDVSISGLGIGEQVASYISKSDMKPALPMLAHV